ncbi:MAG: SLC13 family permease [Gammaproteobacteria bacterium]|nr:SLC13 family permease [Gammaproteobacteria bacterium]MDH3506833.1 SLC13 family permease [Gammaproteobacteria bacterium]
MEPLSLTSGMIASAIVLAMTFLAIFTEQLHGMERSKVAAAGAGLMIVVGHLLGFYSPEAALEAIDFNVIFLLAAMMTIVSIMIPTGGFDWLAYKLARMSKGNLFLMLVLLGTAITLLSLMLDNVTTVVIFGPLIILIARAQKVSPVPYLLAAALLSDTGGVGTLVGDPPNIMIGSAAGIDFNTFFLRMGGIVLVAWLSILVGLKFMFRQELAAEPAGAFEEVGKIKDPKIWRASLAILGGMIVLFMVHSRLHWEAWFVAVIGMSALILVSRHIVMDRALEHVEVTLLMFFIGLFIVIGGVENSRFLEYLGSFITPFVEADLLTATLILMWVGAFLSAAIDNIPFTAAMIPIILGMEQQGINVTPLWWGLAMGVGLGGNGTHIGSTANVFIVTISERLAREQNDPSLAITPWLWFKKGTPLMLLSLVVATIVFWLFFDFFARPI